MKNKIVLVGLLICPLILWGQYTSWHPENILSNGISPQLKTRVLNVCVNIIYDVHPVCAEPYAYDAHWPPALHEGVNNEAIPDNLLDFMDTAYIPGQLRGFITRSLGESSFDSLQLTGDFIIVNMRESRILAKQNLDTVPSNNMPDYDDNIAFNCDRIYFRDAIVEVINQYGFSTIYGHNAIGDYDYLHNNTFYFTHLIYRNISRPYGGLDMGNGYPYNDLRDRRIKAGNAYYAMGSKGITVVGMGSAIITHEICHSLFGSNNFHTSGGNHRGEGGYMPFFPLQGGYGLMGAANKGLASCNGYERWRVHWKHPLAPDYITARNISNSAYANSDVRQEDGSVSFLLRDFVAYGDAIRIQLPYKDRDSSSRQYIWLENHQVGYNSKLDYLRWSDEYPCRPQGKAGIYAYYQVGRDTLSGSSRQVWNADERDNLRIIPAEGYYDYRMQAESYSLACVAYGNMDYTFVREAANPFCGSQDQELQLISNQSGNDTLHIKHEKPIWRKKIGNQITDSLPMNGDNRDAFSGYAKLNMSTNPATCNAKTYYNYMDAGNGRNFDNQIHLPRNTQTTYLTGLSIEMIPKPNHDFLVLIRWDDYDITNDARWTGKIALKEQAVLTRNHHILLTQNQTLAQPYRNPESGLFAAPTLFTCESGSTFTQQPRTTVTLEKKSRMVLDSNSRYLLGDSAQIVVQAGCTLTVKKGAHLITGKEAQLIAEQGGTILLYDSVLLGKSASITVKPGGKLVLNGATLTGAEKKTMWQGITVLGNSSYAQTEFDRQGWLQIGNNSTIEHAACAIRNYKTLSNGAADLSTTGGNISVSSTRFIDNAQAVSLAPYTRSGNRATSFTDCTFEITPTYDFNHAVSKYLVDIKDLKMVYFIKCDFSYPYYVRDTYFPWITAIRVVNTQLTVKGRELCPMPVLGCNSYDNGTFTGFNIAVEAWYTGTTGGTGQLKIDHINFDHNNQGVIIHGYPNFSVTNSDFDIGWGTYLSANRGAVGVATELTPVFELYENSFRGNVSYVTGIHIFNSFTSNSSSYKNIFNNLFVGQRFMGYNRVVNGTASHGGVRYFCNINTNNKGYDILVDTLFSNAIAYALPFPPADLNVRREFSTAYGQGVAYHQAAGNSNALAAGNQFSAGATWHIADYAYAQEYAAGTSPGENPARATSNIRAYSAASNSCPSMNSVEIWHEHINFENLSIGDIVPGGLIDPSDNSTLTPVYHHFRNSTNTLQYLYNQHMNSDNTEALLDAVQGEWKDDVWKMRQELSEISPFVDEKVLRELAMNNLLPQALLLEICLANPDATKNPDF
ncbi:MAG: hypothetical protein LBK03_04250, partial [Bacteroidales bacterium]|nr:hypothetical protein [Bacteroidales bacterium]